eukprot:3544024-Pleurochrysis_carterae.AAC.8
MYPLYCYYFAGLSAIEDYVALLFTYSAANAGVLSDTVMEKATFIQGATAACYRAVRSGVPGYPIRTTHTFIWRVSIYLCFTGSTWSDRPGIERVIYIIIHNTNNQRSGSERGRSGVWTRLRGGSGSGALRRGLHWALRGLQNLHGERGASTPQVRMRCDGNLGNSACAYRFTNARRARRQFVSSCRARERVEMVIFRVSRSKR